MTRLLTLRASRGLLLGARGATFWEKLLLVSPGAEEWAGNVSAELAAHSCGRRRALGGYCQWLHLESCSLQPDRVPPRTAQVFLESWAALSAFLALNVM